jgi:hypothetical protein
MTTRRIVSIKPAEAQPGQAQSVFGTQVLLDDGSVIDNIHRIELVADPETKVWTARLHVHAALLGELNADLVSVTDKR